MYFSNIFDTIVTSSIIISFNPDSFILREVFLSSDNGPKWSPKMFLEITKPEFIVLPSIFIAATPVGASMFWWLYDKLFL